MPVYLCQPGAGQVEPWRHGVQVFSAPCPIDASTSSPSTPTFDLVVASLPDNNNNNNNNNSNNRGENAAAGRGTRPSSIRRVRHAELVLVDDVCIAYNRYWLRLRWPGHRGGFAGYIAMRLVGEKGGPAGEFCCFVWSFSLSYNQSP